MQGKGTWLWQFKTPSAGLSLQTLTVVSKHSFQTIIQSLSYKF